MVTWGNAYVPDPTLQCPVRSLLSLIRYGNCTRNKIQKFSWTAWVHKFSKNIEATSKLKAKFLAEGPQVFGANMQKQIAWANWRPRIYAAVAYGKA